MDTTQELRSEARFDYFKALDDCVDARLVTVDVGRDRRMLVCTIRAPCAQCDTTRRPACFILR